MVEAAAFLSGHCPGWVVIKLGDKGVLATGPNGQSVTLAAPPVVAVDTTGAGDSLAAGILAELADGGTMPSALATGVQVASTVVSRCSRNRYPSRAELLPL